MGRLALLRQPRFLLLRPPAARSYNLPLKSRKYSTHATSGVEDEYTAEERLEDDSSPLQSELDGSHLRAKQFKPAHGWPTRKKGGALVENEEDLDEISRHMYKHFIIDEKEGDSKRVQITNNTLCDDIIERLRPTLQKHVGCDIIDMNPGPGLWSAAIHKALKPRTHILMEPEVELFEPFLQRLLDSDPSYKLFPKSGLIWSQFKKILNPKFLPHQKELPPNDPGLDKPNDTLLLIANLGFSPKKRFGAFGSLLQLVSYQLLSASRSHELCHKYGLVRMLIWVNDEERHIIFPRTIASRSKASIEAELSCEEITEVASSTSDVERGRRFHSVNLDSSIRALRRMEADGISTPAGRLGHLEEEARTSGRSFETPADLLAQVDLRSAIWRELEEKEADFKAGKFKEYQVELPYLYDSEYLTPAYKRFKALSHAEKYSSSWNPTASRQQELNQLRVDFESGRKTKYSVPVSDLPSTLRAQGKLESPEYARLIQLRTRFKSDRNVLSQHYQNIREYYTILEMQKECASPSASETLKEETAKRLAAWKEVINNLVPAHYTTLSFHLDNFRTYCQDRPILFWDRRRAEPLKVHKNEFFPRAELALIDIQPRAISPAIRDSWPDSWEIVSYITDNLAHHRTQSLRYGLNALGEGVYEMVIAECPSITDPSKGGNPDIDVLRVRCLTTEMYEEIIAAWLKWPLRPSLYELQRRLGNDVNERHEPKRLS